MFQVYFHCPNQPTNFTRPATAQAWPKPGARHVDRRRGFGEIDSDLGDASAPVATLVPRQEMIGADRSWAQQYQINDILRYSRSSKETGIKKGEYARVLNVNAKENSLTVTRTSGE